MKLKNKIKRKYYILFSFILILFLFVILFSVYSKKINPKLESYTYQKVKEELDSNIIKNINNIYNDNFNNLLEIVQNSDNEIVYVDYDLNKSYDILNNYVNNLKKTIIKKDIIEVPFLISSDNILLANIGPKIMIKYDFTNSILANIETKVTNFGINNALIEIYLHLEINYLITIPLNIEKHKEKYDLLLNSKVIQGKVPSFYGNSYIKEGAILDIPIE
ncbi:MAG: sporulation protein YunB [bacterium]|nr:sporulation protein YunB [bacterium]